MHGFSGYLIDHNGSVKANIVRFLKDKSFRLQSSAPSANKRTSRFGMMITT